MLSGIVPAAFFATLLQRYFDSLAATQDYIAPSNFLDDATIGSLGTSAVVATIGAALYGLSRITSKKSTGESHNAPSCLKPLKNNQESFLKSKNPNKRYSRHDIRKRRYKTNWFIKNMKHYKSKYGRNIHNVMSRLMGAPVIKSSSEQIQLDNEEILPDDKFSCQISSIDVQPTRNDYNDDNNSELSRRMTLSSINLDSSFEENDQKQQNWQQHHDDDDEFNLKECSKPYSSVIQPKSQSMSNKRKGKRNLRDLRRTSKKTRSGKCYNFPR